MKRFFEAAAVAAAAFVISGCNQESAADSPKADASAANTASSSASSNPIADAESAAPAFIAHNASVVAPQPDGTMKTLRQGNNGWTCMPDDPSTPADDPMCADPNAMTWLAAYLGHKSPPANTVGLVYMLKGASDPSNTDPYATKPPAGADWVKTGPHLMIMGADSLLKNYPSGSKPDTSGPYVMWGGTPYQHLMVPVR